MERYVLNIQEASRRIEQLYTIIRPEKKELSNWTHTQKEKYKIIRTQNTAKKETNEFGMPAAARWERKPEKEYTRRFHCE